MIFSLGPTAAAIWKKPCAEASLYSTIQRVQYEVSLMHYVADDGSWVTPHGMILAV